MGTDRLRVELGAEWIGENHTQMQALCREFSLPLDDNRFQTHLLFEGRYYTPRTRPEPADWVTKLRGLYDDFSKLPEDSAQRAALDGMDWWRYLVNASIPGDELLLRDLFDSTDFGESIRHVSALATSGEYAQSSTFNEMDWKIQGGNSRLPEALAGAVGHTRIRTGDAAVSVEQTARGMRVRTASGPVLEGDVLICTLPTFSVSRIDSKPALPAGLVDGINALQYARIAKNPMLFSGRFWPREDTDLVTDSPVHYFYHATKNQSST